jgi:hypothetical protein
MEDSDPNLARGMNNMHLNRDPMAMEQAMFAEWVRKAVIQNTPGQLSKKNKKKLQKQLKITIQNNQKLENMERSMHKKTDPPPYHSVAAQDTGGWKTIQNQGAAKADFNKTWDQMSQLPEMDSVEKRIGLIEKYNKKNPKRKVKYGDVFAKEPPIQKINDMNNLNESFGMNWPQPINQNWDASSPSYNGNSLVPLVNGVYPNLASGGNAFLNQDVDYGTPPPEFTHDYAMNSHLPYADKYFAGLGTENWAFNNNVQPNWENQDNEGEARIAVLTTNPNDQINPPGTTPSPPNLYSPGGSGMVQGIPPHGIASPTNSMLSSAFSTYPSGIIAPSVGATNFSAFSALPIQGQTLNYQAGVVAPQQTATLSVPTNTGINFLQPQNPQLMAQTTIPVVTNPNVTTVVGQPMTTTQTVNTLPIMQPAVIQPIATGGNLPVGNIPAGNLPAGNLTAGNIPVGNVMIGQGGNIPPNQNNPPPNPQYAPPVLPIQVPLNALHITIPQGGTGGTLTPLTPSQLKCLSANLKFLEPHYRGNGQELKNYLANAKKAKDNLRWTDSEMCHYLNMSIRGDAGRWLNRQEQITKDDYHLLERALLQKYLMPTDQITFQKQLREITQESTGKTIARFAEVVTEMVTDHYMRTGQKNDDEIQAQIKKTLVSGMHDALLERVTRVHYDNILDLPLDKILETSRREEQFILAKRNGKSYKTIAQLTAMEIENENNLNDSMSYTYVGNINEQPNMVPIQNQVRPINEPQEYKLAYDIPRPNLQNNLNRSEPIIQNNNKRYAAAMAPPREYAQGQYPYSQQRPKFSPRANMGYPGSNFRQQNNRFGNQSRFNQNQGGYRGPVAQQNKPQNTGGGYMPNIIPYQQNTGGGYLPNNNYARNIQNNNQNNQRNNQSNNNQARNLSNQGYSRPNNPQQNIIRTQLPQIRNNTTLAQSESLGNNNVTLAQSVQPQRNPMQTTPAKWIPKPISPRFCQKHNVVHEGNGVCPDTKCYMCGLPGHIVPMCTHRRCMVCDGGKPPHKHSTRCDQLVEANNSTKNFQQWSTLQPQGMGQLHIAVNAQ